MHDQNNVFYAIALSVVVLIAWQYFFATSFLGKPAGPNTSQARTSQIGSTVSGTGIIRTEAPAAAIPGPQRAEPSSRQQALARSPRVAIDTPRLKGSIALTGGRIDDLSLTHYRETTDPGSAAIELLRRRAARTRSMRNSAGSTAPASI